MSGPGSWLRAFAVLLFRPPTIERLIDPIISDLQIEYNATLGGSWRRRGVLLRAYCGFWKALAIHTVLSVGGGSAERNEFRRAIAFSCLACAIGTVLLALPPLVNGTRLPTGKTHQLMLALTLIPQALPISIPVGVCIGIMSAGCGRTLTRRHLLNTLMIGFTAACVVWVVLEWGVPLGNQTFRDIVIAGGHRRAGRSHRARFERARVLRACPPQGRRGGAALPSAVGPELRSDSAGDVYARGWCTTSPPGVPRVSDPADAVCLLRPPVGVSQLPAARRADPGDLGAERCVSYGRTNVGVAPVGRPYGRSPNRRVS